jgi:hypothetical protein
MNNSNISKDVLPEIKNPKAFYVIIFMILFMIITLFLIYFNVNIFQKQTNSEQEVTNNIFIIFFFCLIILGLCYVLLPNLKELKKLSEQISNVSYFILYTIGVILYFGLVPSDVIDEYSYILVPVIIFLGIGIFYLSATRIYIEEFNINYERIKTILLFLCLLTNFIIFYNKDPGGFISKYFGYTFLLAILIGVFSLIYLIIVLTLPDRPNTKLENTNLLFNKFTATTNFLNIGFFIFILTIVIMIATYKNDNYDSFFDNTTLSITFMILTILISILWLLLISVNAFPEIIDKNLSVNYFSLFKRSLLVLFSIIISCIFITWIVYSIQIYSGNSTIGSLLLNIAIVLIIFGLIYKTISVKLPVGNNKKNAFFNLILNIILYIPCCFSGLFDSIGKLLTANFSGEAGSLLMLLIVIALIIIYFKMPSIFNIINLQGGKQLVNKPVNTNTLYPLGTYKDLNGSEDYDYQYALSFWVFINAAGPNMNVNYSKDTSLLNYAGKPNIVYNGKTNTLMILMANKEKNRPTKIDKKNISKLTDFDENGNRILYVNSDFLLQKWNNIIINYNGGVLDIFLNGELVKSNIDVVPYYTLDNLTIGQDKGIEGGICNVVYYTRPLTSANIYFIYNMVKDRSPPVLNDSNETILVEGVMQIN